jgi:hypothetical protein
MDISAPVEAKRKRGFPRKPGEVPATVEAQRRHRDRAKLQEMVETTAVAAATAAAKSLTPPDVTDDLRDLIESSAQEVSRILATNSPAVIQATIDKAISGDVGAAALLLKHCISTKTKIRLDTQPGATLEEFADSIIAQTVAGTLSLEDGESFLRLAERHSNVTLHASLSQRLAKLNEQLAQARETRVIASDVTLSRTPIKLEQFIEMYGRDGTGHKE